MLLVDMHRNPPKGNIVASYCESEGRRLYTVRSRLLQVYIDANKHPIEQLMEEVKQRGSTRYHLISKEDRDHPKAAAKRLVDKLFGKGK